MQEGGLASVNKGYMATMLRDSVASFFYFSTYAILKHSMTPEGMEQACPSITSLGGDPITHPVAITSTIGQTQPGMAGTLFAGGMAGIFNWLGCIPIDTLKTKLQTAPEGRSIL